MSYQQFGHIAIVILWLGIQGRHASPVLKCTLSKLRYEPLNHLLWLRNVQSVWMLFNTSKFMELFGRGFSFTLSSTTGLKKGVVGVKRYSRKNIRIIGPQISSCRTRNGEDFQYPDFGYKTSMKYSGKCCYAILNDKNGLRKSRIRLQGISTHANYFPESDYHAKWQSWRSSRWNVYGKRNRLKLLEALHYHRVQFRLITILIP